MKFVARHKNHSNGRNVIVMFLIIYWLEKRKLTQEEQEHAFFMELMMILKVSQVQQIGKKLSSCTSILFSPH